MARLLNEREKKMKLASRCIPTEILPYQNEEAATRMMAKLFEKAPSLAMLPVVSKDDNLIKRTLGNIPGVKIKDKKVVLKMDTTSYKNGITKLDKAYNSPDLRTLEHFEIESPFLEKYFQMIKKFNCPNAFVSLLGPFTISQILNQAAEEQVLTDKSFRKLFIQAVCVKALWIIEKIKEVNPSTVPVIILEEPSLSNLGDLKRENEEVTIELVTNLFAKVVEKLKAAGAYVGVQCMGKCDWKIPMAAGVDMISFDAYNNPNNLCIMPDQVIEFVSRGGKINWAIIPTISESVVKALNIDYVTNRLIATMEGLILAGVPEKFVYNSALVSIQGSVENLPLIFAEKAIILSTQLAKRIPVKAED